MLVHRYYFQADTLKMKDMWVPEISKKIAEKVGKVHALQVPINKEPVYLWETMENWLNTLHQMLPKVLQEGDAEAIVAAQKYIKTNLEEEVKWLK